MSISRATFLRCRTQKVNMSIDPHVEALAWEWVNRQWGCRFAVVGIAEAFTAASAGDPRELHRLVFQDDPAFVGEVYQTWVTKAARNLAKSVR